MVTKVRAFSLVRYVEAALALAEYERDEDDIDGQHILGIFVGEVLAPPQRIFGEQLADRLERQRLHAPRLERRVVIGVAFGMNMHTAA